MLYLTYSRQIWEVRLVVGHEVLVRQWAVFGDIFNRGAVRDNPAFLSSLSIFGTIELGETPLVGSHDLLTSRELELGTTQSLNNVGSVVILGAHREDDLADSNTGSHFHWLAVRSTHTGGETICAGAGKHLVLTDDVERVGTATNVVTFLAGGLDKVLVACDTSGFKSASGQLFLLIGDQVGNEWELIDRGLLGSAIINSDLGIWDTTAETRLNVRLVLLETNATSWS